MSGEIAQLKLNNKRLSFADLLSIWIRFDLIPKNNRLKNKSHDEAKRAIQTSLQGLDVDLEELFYSLRRGRFSDGIIGTVEKYWGDTYSEYIKGMVKDIEKKVVKINKIRKFLTSEIVFFFFFFLEHCTVKGIVDNSPRGQRLLWDNKAAKP